MLSRWDRQSVGHLHPVQDVPLSMKDVPPSELKFPTSSNCVQDVVIVELPGSSSIAGTMIPQTLPVHA